MDILTDFPERLRQGRIVYVGEEHQPLKLAHVRRQDTAMLVTFEGLDHIDLIGFLRNQIVYIRADRLPKLPEGEYYHHELLGLKVVDENGKEIGFLSEILETGANDVYLIVATDGTETLLPAIEAVILEVNLDRREMLVRVPEWL